jgi:hypothetical protein
VPITGGMSSLARISVLLVALAVAGVFAWRSLQRPAAVHRGSAQAVAAGPGAPALRYVIVSERARREGFGAGVRTLLEAGRFRELQSLADTLLRGGLAYESGVSQFHVLFAQGFSNVDDPSDAAQWEEHLSRLRQWDDGVRGSTVAPVALAQALIGRAWAARGEGPANGVSGDAWRRFDADVEAAGRILEQCGNDVRANPEWWEAALQVLHAQGVDQDSVYRATSLDACARFPLAYHFYNEMAVHLLPRWYGEPGDWQRYAEGCARVLPDSLGAEVYARILVSQARLLPNVFEDGGTVSWDLALRGLEAWHRRFPQSDQPARARAMLAWEAGRRPDAIAAFEQLRDTVDTDIWRTTERYERARAWANGGAGVAALR